MHDLIIIGAGPAGLTAALYAGRARLKTLLLEKSVVGGRILMSEEIENFPGFVGGIRTEELISRMTEQVRQLAVQFCLEEALEIDPRLKTVKTSAGVYSAKAVIVSTGARPRKLNVPGEDRLTGKGVSYCATCDAPIFREKNVFVVGGGNAVAEEALYLARFARTVGIVHRRSDLRASMILQERLKENKKINFILNSVIVQISGAAKVESLKIRDVNTAKESELPCDGVFIYVGYEPETEFLRNSLKLEEAGFIVSGDDLSTSVEGVFACGDCRKKSLYQMVNACGDGAVAADSAYKYIAGKK
ncbi:MAG: thioredoxin-disulfide reductase [Omnitrophica WOR_2 bacterium RIFCSPLOWO2_12_FULL_51_8]|nr:MAG: thioredoxin-disulfide reductase [Omnitrophica WOR_2 bacterium RIFCSPLOWO2_12_FULL_51_8]